MTDKEIIAHADRLDLIGPSEDGYQYFWPQDNNSCIDAHTLRVIADELDRRNKEWDAKVNDELSRSRTVGEPPTHRA